MNKHIELATYLLQQKTALKKTFKILAKQTKFSQTYLKTIFSGKYLPTTPTTLKTLSRVLKADYSTIVNLSISDRSNRLKEKLLYKKEVKK